MKRVNTVIAGHIQMAQEPVPKLTIWSYAVIATGIFLAARALFKQLPLTNYWWLAMVALVVLVSPVVVISIPRVKARITLGDTITFATALFFGAAAAVLTAMAEAAFASLRMTRSVRKVLYNTATLIVAMQGACWLATLFFPPFGERTTDLTLTQLVGALGLLTLGYFILSTSLIAAYLAISTNESFWRVWKENGLWTSISYGASGLSALGVYLLVGRFGYSSFLIAVGAMMFVYLFYRTYFEKVESANQRADFIEEQLRHSQKMEAIGRLAGGVAHDFNNLLTAILIYSDLLLHKLDAQDPLRQHIEEIHKAGNRAASLTRQLLAFSRKQILKPQVMSLNQVVTDMVAMLMNLIGEDIEFSVRLDAQLGNIQADPGQIEQVIMNLVINARDAIAQGGKVTVETTRVEVSELRRFGLHAGIQEGTYAMLAVSDTGCGMDKETMSQIFEPFFTTKEEGKGTGLGLSTVYGIVHQSGGDIQVESQLNEGTVFRIYFPQLPDSSPPPPLHKAAASQAGQAATILLVENEDVVRQLMRGIFHLEGHTVIDAANGKEALKLCEEHGGRIDLVITDVVMPHMSGREFIRQLRSQQPEITVLYISGYASDVLARHGVENESLNFLQKPFTHDVLLSRVRELLAVSDPYSPAS